MIKEAISKVIEGQNLSLEEVRGVMLEMMEGKATSAQIGSFLTALRIKGETVEEITGCAQIMRLKATPIKTRHAFLIDTCGTGGDNTHSFNISTTAAFVVAGAGGAVAKHGNRAVSSQCGSADVLEALGVKLELTASQVGTVLDEVGIGFLYAPTFHQATKHAVGPRKEIGIRTIFNVLGPLTNPIGAQAQVVGVYDPKLTETLAKVLQELGTPRALVVNGAGGMDELSTLGPSHISCLKEGRIESFVLDPQRLGLEKTKPEFLRGGTVQENARLTRSILEGEQGPRRDIVILNAAGALMISGLSQDIEEGIKKAQESIDSGKAIEKLEQLVAMTNKV